MLFVPSRDHKVAKLRDHEIASYGIAGYGIKRLV